MLSVEDIGRSLDDVDLLARVVVSLSTNVGSRIARVDQRHVDLAEFVLERADRIPPQLTARVMCALALELFWGDQSARMRSLAKEALELARPIGDPELIADVLRTQDTVSDPTDPEALDRMLTHVSETIKLAAGIDDRLLCNSYWARAVNLLIRGDVDGAAADFDEMERLADRLRIPTLTARSMHWRAARALLSGDLQECDALLSDYEAYCSREPAATSAAVAPAIRYRLQYERGDLAAMEGLLEAMVESQPAIPAWRMALCGVYLQSDRPELAISHVDAVAADDFSMVPRNALFLLTCSSTARIASQVGSLAAAEAAYRHAAPFDGQFSWVGSYLELPIGVGVGAAATALGRYDLAEQHFANARTLCKRAGAKTYLVATDVHEAEMLVQRDAPGDARRAMALATQSLEASERLGLGYMRRRSEALLAG